MKITGTAIQIQRKIVISPCGYTGRAGYASTGNLYGAEAKVSFIPKSRNATKLDSLLVDGKRAKIIKHSRSEHMPNMWTFYINFLGDDNGSN